MKRFPFLTALAIGLGLLGQTGQTFGQAFTAGDIVVTQVGATGSGTALASSGTATFLKEFSPTGGAVVQSYSLPTTSGSGNNPLTISGTAGSEGELSDSANGQYLVIAGYDVGVGGTTQGTSTIGLIKYDGTINTSSTTTGLSGNNTRGAASVDGTQFWVTGPKGLVYGSVGSSGSNITSTPNDRSVIVVSAVVSPTGANQLFGSSQKDDPAFGVLQFTPALPTSSTSGAALPGMNDSTVPNTNAFFFANATTLFIADGNDGIQEWTKSGSNWSNVATTTNGGPSYVGIAGAQTGNTVKIYATTGTTSGWSADNKLNAFTFTFNSGTTGTGTFSSATTLETATGDSGFSGVAMAPTSGVVVNSSVLTLPTTASFGNVLKNGSVSTTFTLTDTGGTASDSYTGAVSNNGITAPTSGNAAVGSNTVTATLNANANGSATSNSTASWTYTITNTANTGDTGGNKSVTISANVGNATADTSNQQNVFGSALNGVVASAGSYVNLSSTVTGGNGATNPGPGPLSGTMGGPIEHTTATILAGTNSGPNPVNVSMAWRTRQQTETPVSEGGTPTSPPLNSLLLYLVSDVVNLNLTDTVTSGSKTDLFALQMSYDPTTLGAVSIQNAMVAHGFLYLATLDPNGNGVGIPGWDNAVTDNTGNNATPAEQGYIGSFAAFQLANGTTLANYVGAWGVDTTNDQAWAVVDHNSQFAVVPEPATLTLVACGALAGLLGLRRRVARLCRTV